MNSAGAKAGPGLLCALAVVFACLPVHAQDKAQDKGDKSVITLMNYTWMTLPTMFRHPNGEVIVVDKTKKQEVMIPLEKAREIVAVADRSARAQYCGLIAEQDANYQAMMRRERNSEHWSSQQILFISLLHATTVAYMTGSARFQFGEAGQKDAEVVTKGPIWTEPCTDDVRETIKARILAYVNEAGSAVAKAPVKGTEPVSGTQKN